MAGTVDQRIPPDNEILSYVWTQVISNLVILPLQSIASNHCYTPFFCKGLVDSFKTTIWQGIFKMAEAQACHQPVQAAQFSILFPDDLPQ